VAASRYDRSERSGPEEKFMKFMFMIYHDENVLDAMPKGEMQALIDSALDYDDEIRQSGHYIVSDALESSRTARTIRVRGGKVSTTDGPFAETKEQLAGYYILDCGNLDEAIAWAAKIPTACKGGEGCIEIRPIAEIPPR
jgi:hypothetical protein